VKHAEQIRVKEEVDLQIDPPPDLVIEVEITTSAIHKMVLFAAMGVPEVWRHNGDELTMHVLTGSEYLPIPESVALPGFTPEMVDAILAQRFDMGETALIRSFRKSLAMP